MSEYEIWRDKEYPLWHQSPYLDSRQRAGWDAAMDVAKREIQELRAQLADRDSILREAEALSGAEKGNLLATIIHMKDRVKNLREQLEEAENTIFELTFKV